MKAKARVFSIVLGLTFWLLAAVSLSSIGAEVAYACHGNGVSRVCPCGNYCMILESLSYDSPTYSYEMIHADGDVYWMGSWQWWQTCTHYNDWRCSALRFDDGLQYQYDVYSNHLFRHYGGSNYGGSSEAHGECFPGEWDGC